MFFTGVQIGYGARIGPGLFINHFGCIIISNRSVIGKNFTINQQAMVAARGPSDGWQFPTIGDNVWVAPGAKILGGVHVGDNVVIGANAVVINDVPNGVIVAGIPAKIISHDVSKWFK